MWGLDPTHIVRKKKKKSIKDFFLIVTQVSRSNLSRNSPANRQILDIAVLLLYQSAVAS